MALGQLIPRRQSQPRELRAWSPRREMEQVFEDFFRDFRDLTETPIQGVFPSVDMYEEKDKIVVKAEAPGLEKDDIKVSVTDHVLQIRGEKKQEEEKEDRDYYYSERFYGVFSREVPLPSAVNPDQIKANFKNGVLTIEIPKSKEQAGKEIKIEAK